jgi:hypothetical protein
MERPDVREYDWPQPSPHCHNSLHSLLLGDVSQEAMLPSVGLEGAEEPDTEGSDSDDDDAKLWRAEAAAVGIDRGESEAALHEGSSPLGRTGGTKGRDVAGAGIRRSSDRKDGQRESSSSVEEKSADGHQPLALPELCCLQPASVEEETRKGDDGRNAEDDPDEEEEEEEAAAVESYSTHSMCELGDEHCCGFIIALCDEELK